MQIIGLCGLLKFPVDIPGKVKCRLDVQWYKGREGRVGITLVSPGQSGDAQILSEIVTPMN